MSSARDQILGTLRAGLRGTTQPPLPAAQPPRALPVDERVERFAAVLTKVFGHVDVVANWREAGVRAAAILAAANAKSVALSDAPELREVTAALPASLRQLPHDAERADLLAADAGLTMAQYGIAETGTLVLESAREQHRLASLLPALHLVVLPRSRLLGTLAEAFARLQQIGAPSSRTITFVTGPSRTADIELELVVGVHGPKFLHVLLVDDA